MATRELAAGAALRSSSTATRIMRAVRYEQRLRFWLDDDTEALLRRDLPMLDAIGEDRLRRELHLWFKEEHSVEILARADQLGVMAAIYQPLAGSGDTVRSAIERTGQRNLDEQVYVGLLSYLLNPSEGERFIGRLRMPHRWATVVRDTINLKSKLSRFSDATFATLSPAQLYEALAPFTPAAVQACALAISSEEARQNLILFLEKLRYARPSLGGRDLIDLGVLQGMAVGEMLVRLRSARLDGAVTSRAEEVALVKSRLASQNVRLP